MKTVKDLKGKIYFTCCACMSVYADALSWANANPDRVTKDINAADNIVVLSCQVTDLAIYNDFEIAKKLHYENNYKQVFISGCLAQRLDINLPFGIHRLEQMRCTYQHINDKTLVNFEKPFWIKNFKENNDNNLEQGNIFRNMYPLRIGKGCSFNCTYCTIRLTRGKHEKYDLDNRLVDEFMSHDNVLLIADSPTSKQIKDWCNLAIEKNKKISIRNIEPQIAVKCSLELVLAAKNGLLKTFHCPIQSNNVDVLKDMERAVGDTLLVIDMVKDLRLLGTKIATNVIIDYKDYPNDFDEIYEIYDYVSWNPLWDGKWDYYTAKARFEKYISNKQLV